MEAGEEQARNRREALSVRGQNKLRRPFQAPSGQRHPMVFESSQMRAYVDGGMILSSTWFGKRSVTPEVGCLCL